MASAQWYVAHVLASISRRVGLLAFLLVAAQGLACDMATTRPCAANELITSGCTCGDTWVATNYCCNNVPQIASCGGLSTSKDVTAFSISGFDGVILGNTISLVLPVGTPLTNLTPTIEHTGVSVSPASGEARSFKSPVTYTVTAEDASTKVYTATVTAATATAPSDIYYVAMGGSDTAGDGSSEKPWRTLSKACSSVHDANGVIHIRPGTYTETSQCLLAEGVSIEGDGPASVIESHVGSMATILLSSAAQGTHGNQHISGIKMDGDSLTGYVAIKVQRRSSVSIHHCELVDFSHEGIVFTGGSANVAPTTYAVNNSIYNNKITNCAGYEAGSGGFGNVHISGQQGMLIHDNIITATGRPHGSNGVCIKSVSEAGSTRGLKIYGNVLQTDQGWGDNQQNQYKFAIELWDGQGTEIDHNEIYGTIDIGGYRREKGIYDYGIAVHDNFIGSRNSTPIHLIAFVLEPTIICDEVRIYRNVIKNVGRVAAFYPWTDGVYSNVKFYYNIFDQIGHNQAGWGEPVVYGFRGSNGHLPQSISHFYFLNNIFNMSTYPGAMQANAIEIPCDPAYPSSYWYIQNNIIIGSDEAAIATKSTGTIDHLWITNNIFFGNGNSNSPLLRITPTAYTPGPNYTSDPMFASSTDFHLTGSTGINQGADVGLDSDFVGNAIVGAPDIGVYENQ